MFFGCIVLSDTKEAKLGSSNQEASLWAGKCHARHKSVSLNLLQLVWIFDSFWYQLLRLFPYYYCCYAQSLAVLKSFLPSDSNRSGWERYAIALTCVYVARLNHCMVSFAFAPDSFLFCTLYYSFYSLEILFIFNFLYSLHIFRYLILYIFFFHMITFSFS